MDDRPEQQPGPAGDEPENPFTPLIMGALGLHEFYSSLTSSGFTSNEALYLVAAAMAGGPKGPA